MQIYKFIPMLMLMLMLSIGVLFNANAAPTEQTAVFAGDCFWGVDAVFKHVKGVINVESGYSGGDANTAHYEMVSRGNTGHAESVRVNFDPAQIYIQKLTAAHVYPFPIVTQLVPLTHFYRAEEYHQNYLALHPHQPYIVLNDMPKLEQLQKQFPALYH